LAERMFFARYAEKQHAERNSTEAVAEGKSHNALAQLSASPVTCKPKARDSSAFRLRSTTAAAAAFASNAQALGNAPLQKIERRRCRLTIRRGGSHRQTQRVERSLRSRSAILRNPAVFCADFLHAEGCALLGLVQPYFAGKSSSPEFHRASGCDYRRNLLSIHWRRCVPFGRNPAGFRCRKTVLSRFAVRAAVGLDRSVYHIGCLFTPCAAVSFAGVARRLQHPGAGRLDRIRFRRSAPWITPQRCWPTRYASPAHRNLCNHTDPGHRTASNSSCSRNGCPYAAYERKAGGVAIAPQAAQIGSEGKTGD
jgi:hypothetical protein